MQLELARIEIDLTRAYPLEAKIETGMRALIFNKNESIDLEEEYRLIEPNEVMLSFLTPCDVVIEIDRLHLGIRQIDEDRLSGTLDTSYDPALITVRVETIELDARST